MRINSLIKQKFSICSGSQHHKRFCCEITSVTLRIFHLKLEFSSEVKADSTCCWANERQLKRIFTLEKLQILTLEKAFARCWRFSILFWSLQVFWVCSKISLHFSSSMKWKLIKRGYKLLNTIIPKKSSHTRDFFPLRKFRKQIQNRCLRSCWKRFSSKTIIFSLINRVETVVI